MDIESGRGSEVIKHLHIPSAYSSCEVCGEIGFYNAAAKPKGDTMSTEEKVYRVARIVAALVGQGNGWNESVEQCAFQLGVSEKSVWHCVNETRRNLSDPYLESLA